MLASSALLQRLDRLLRERVSEACVRNADRLKKLRAGASPSQFALQARLNFKIAHAFELAGLPVKVVKYYQAAYSALLELLARGGGGGTGGRAEVRTVADWVTYRLARTLLGLGESRGALAQLSLHLRSFAAGAGGGPLDADHFAWLASQNAVFAALLLAAPATAPVAAGGAAAAAAADPYIVPSHYYHQAAVAAVSRRSAAERAGLASPPRGFAFPPTPVSLAPPAVDEAEGAVVVPAEYVGGAPRLVGPDGAELPREAAAARLAQMAAARERAVSRC